MSENEMYELTQKLKEEANDYYRLAKEYRRSRQIRENTENILLNRIWLSKWKKYVDYKTIKESNQNLYTNFSKREVKINTDSFPGKIDNTPLLVPLDNYLNDGNPNNEENYVVRHDIDIRNELKIVNKKIWEFFQSRYNGGPYIEKPWIEDNTRSYTSSRVIEVFWRKLTIVTLPDRKFMTEELLREIKPEIIYISRTVNLDDLKEKILNIKKSKNFYEKDATIKNLRLFKIINETWDESLISLINNNNKIRESSYLVKYDKIAYLEDIPLQKLDDTDLADTDICIVEYSINEKSFTFEVETKKIRQDNCEYCSKFKYLKNICVCKEVAYCSLKCMQNDKTYHKNKCRSLEEDEDLKERNDSRRGLTGLQNLGNTCFMNTSLQCLSNCYELTEYFLKDYYKTDINKDNPIGTGGNLANAYAIFLKNIWYGSSSVYSPWGFKRAISGFQSMFSGYQQHDAEEFLNFLLDGLHEDLNRVISKPFVEKNDSKKPDDIKSLESWTGFLKRNQSLLVDLFYGQFKSTLYCPDPECQNISTCFDPFLSISLPLVSRTETYELTCFFIFFDLSIKPLQLDVQFSSETTIMALRNKVSKMMNIHPFSFLVAKLQNLANFDRFLCSKDLLKPNNTYSSSKKQQFFLYQIDPNIFYSLDNKFYGSSISEKFKDNSVRNFKATKSDIEKNKHILNELFDVDYEEDESGTTQEKEIYYSKKFGRDSTPYLINTDDNNGFDEDWIKVLIYPRKYTSLLISRREALSFPRVIYLKKTWTLKEIHCYVIYYFSNLIRISDEKNLNLTNEELFRKFFKNITNQSLYVEGNDTVQSHKEAIFPFRIRINNIIGNNLRECHYCDNSNCSGCLVPFSDITLKEYIQKIPKNESGKEIDNSYFFLHEKYKNFIAIGNRDFSLDISWIEPFYDSVKTLLEKEIIDFKLQRHDRADGIDIKECFRNFIKLEKLEDNNEWFCPYCKNHIKATKKMEIYNCPNILIIHLKRFKNNTKIDTLVNFPIENLDITDFVLNKKSDEKHIYDLFAVSNHSGSMGFGHYTAYAKNYFTNKWYDFDDSHVSLKNEDDIVSTNAYVLFYRRRGFGDNIDLKEFYIKKFVNFNENYTDDAKNFSENEEKDSSNCEDSKKNSFIITLSNKGNIS